MINYLKYPYLGRIRGILAGSLTSIILKPIQFSCRQTIVGNRVFIHKHARIEAVSRYMDDVFDPQIVIGDDVTIQQNIHLTCAQRVEIGANTAIAANVTITDINHQYEDITQPVDKQPIIASSVTIGQNCKIYNNAVILPGTKLGKHCVVGANSVVSGVFESFSVIAGSPARVVKRYNLETKTWEKVK